MTTDDPPLTPPSPDGELALLLQRLHETQQRIAELSGASGGDSAAPLQEAVEPATNVRDDARLRAAILDTLPAHIALLDREGRIVTVNRAWREFAQANGLGDDAAGIGTNYLHVCTNASGHYSDEAPAAAVGIRSVLAGERRSFELEYPCHGPGVERWFRLVVNALDGPASGVVVMHLDITARRALEAKLSRAQRLESVGQLTGGVAHDFNNLLTVILGNAELLVESLSDDRLPMARSIVEAATSGAELVSNLLAFARRQALLPRAIDVNALLLGMDELLRRALGEHVEVDLQLASGLPNALVDPAGLENAVLNLCLNARDAMPDGGRLTLRTGVGRLAGETGADADEAEPGEYLTLSVTDDGEGMGADVLARAFDPFFTTKPIGKGSGLGLSMVYGFVRQSSGQVTIDSAPGDGTVVTMYLPTAEDTRPRRHAGEGAGDDAPSGHGETVLLVEDQPEVLDYVRSQLTRLGYEVLAATNAAAALELLGRGRHIDLLFTDIVMPGGINGHELARRACELMPGLKVLFTSGYSDTWILSRADLSVDAPMLSKPYRRAELARALREALAEG